MSFTKKNSIYEEKSGTAKSKYCSENLRNKISFLLEIDIIGISIVLLLWPLWRSRIKYGRLPKPSKHSFKESNNMVVKKIPE